MFKLAFFSCAVLFASAANATLWSEKVEAAQQKVEGAIDIAIDEIKAQLEAAKQTSFAIAEKIEAAALEYTEKVKGQISTFLKEIQDEVDKLTGNADGVDVTECTRFAAHLERTALSAVSNMSVCVVDKLELGAGYIDKMIKISEKAYSNLTTLREEAHKCGENVDSVSTAFEAVICTNWVAAEATWTAARVVPEFSINIAKLSYLLSTLQPSLTYCATTNGLKSFYRESSTIVDNTKNCIQQKIDELRDAEPEAHGTEISHEHISE